MFVGWDWGNVGHDVSIVAPDGARTDRWGLEHTEQGFTTTLARLRRHGEPSALPIAIETNRGLVVDRLLAAGHPVVPIHPNAFNAVRPRWGAARAKTDAGDSFKLADYLRTDSHQLRVLAPTESATLDVQALVRARANHVAARITATNQLAATLDEHWPGGKAIFAQLATPIALTFLRRFPTSRDGAKLTPAKMTAFCRRHHYSGRRPAAELLDRMRQAPKPASRVGPQIVRQLVLSQVTLLRALLAGIAELERAITAALAEHPYAALLRELPRVGTVNLAQIIGEVGPMLERAESADHLAAETGTAPVTKASGKSHTVSFRVAVNHHARQALTTFADNSRHSSAWAAEIYTAARARGKRHPHAIRILARAWIRVIWACWRDGTPYNPHTHQMTTKRPSS